MILRTCEVAPRAPKRKHERIVFHNKPISIGSAAKSFLCTHVHVYIYIDVCIYKIYMGICLYIYTHIHMQQMLTKWESPRHPKVRVQVFLCKCCPPVSQHVNGTNISFFQDRPQVNLSCVGQLVLKTEHFSFGRETACQCQTVFDYPSLLLRDATIFICAESKPS